MSFVSFQMAYKQWLCSVYHPYYNKGDQIKPCIDTCDLVSESCPFFRPYGDTLIGEPGFLCKGKDRWFRFPIFLYVVTFRYKDQSAFSSIVKQETLLMGIKLDGNCY